jgi:hypothetical protein
LFRRFGCFKSYQWTSYLIEKAFSHTRIAWVEQAILHILTICLHNFSGLDTCVCWFTCEMTNLVVFLSLFSKMFLMAFYNFIFFWSLQLFCGFCTLCFTLCSFETKRGSIFLIWTGIVFLNWSSDFCPRIAKEGDC